MNDAVRFGLKLLARMVGTLVAATGALFVMIELSITGGLRSVVMPPGVDPDNVNNPIVARLNERYHFDDPLPLRYLHWVFDALGGDFGRSTRGGVPVSEVISHRLPITLQLTAVAIGLAILVGIPLGAFAAARHDTRLGRVVSGGLAVAQGVPVFLTATFAIGLFAVKLQWLPANGWTRISNSLGGNLTNLILPATALATAEAAIIGRVVRADLVDIFSQDFIAAARAKGLKTGYIVWRHALRPASLGVLNVIGLNIGSLVSGAMVIEIVFGIGGLGQQFFEASVNRDFFLLLGLTAYSVIVYVLVNAIVDVLVYRADPRIRRS